MDLGITGYYFYRSLPNNPNTGVEKYLTVLCDGYDEVLTELIENEGLESLQNKKYNSIIEYIGIEPSGLTEDNTKYNYILDLATTNLFTNQTVLAVIGIPESLTDNTNIQYYALPIQDANDAQHFDFSILIPSEILSTIAEKNCEEFFILLFAYDN